MFYYKQTFNGVVTQIETRDCAAVNAPAFMAEITEAEYNALLAQFEAAAGSGVCE